VPSVFDKVFFKKTIKNIKEAQSTLNFYRQSLAEEGEREFARGRKRQNKTNRERGEKRGREKKQANHGT
jgi:hypothetical protein